METNQQAIVLLLGAKSSGNPLPAIPEELSTLKYIFESHQTENLPQYDIKYEPFFTQKHLKTWLDDFADHIAILHFAGHSDPNSIQTDDSVVRAEDIAAHINTWTRRPDLVFLNGCQNQSQAQIFLDAGVSAVVATQRAVDDKFAASFAHEFYNSLLAQNGNASLTVALEQAKAKLGFEQSETTRSLDVDEETTQTSRWNWNLFLKDAEQAHLSLHKLLTLNRPRYDAAGQLINPYQGLAAFKEEDRGFFFGREQLTNQLVTTLDETPFLALLGSSGSGKSSLINAGIIPELRLAKDCLIFKTRPGNDPFAEIARCIAQHLYPEKAQLSQRLRESKQLATDYQLHPENLSEFLQVCLQESGKRRLVLFIDQFEELFTHSDSDAAKAAVKQYETALAELVTNAAGTMTLVLTMRADFLGTALTHQTLGALLDQYSQYSKYLSPMSSAELRSVILEPAAKQGVSVEDGLTDQLLDELKKNTESLPLLQHVLSLLWQSRDSSTLTLLDYTRLGGIETALETQANQYLDSLDSSEQREQVKRIFLRLINLGEGQDDTRRRADMAEFGTEPAVETLIQQLAKERLVATQGDDSHNSFVEISHETLIRSWGKLKEWINEDRDQLRIQHQVSKAAKDWAEHEYEESWLLSGLRLAVADEWLKDNESIASESEKKLLRASKAKEKKKKNRIISVVAVVIALLTGFAVFAGFQWSAAVEEKLAANYNLAKAFEEKTLSSISRGDVLANKDPYSPEAKSEYRNALLYALETQKRQIPNNKTAILPVSLGRISRIPDSALESELYQTPHLKIGSIKAIAYNPDGKTIASGSSDNSIRLWNAQSGETISTLKGHSDWVSSIAYSPDGKTIASGSDDGTIHLWNAQSGETINTLKGHSRAILTIAYNPDGKTIASCSTDGTIQLWNAQSGETVNTLKGYSGFVETIAYSPDGKTIASGSTDGTIQLWNAQSGETINILKGHLGRVRTIAYSTDGKTIASSSDDYTIRLWNAQSGKTINTLKGHLSRVRTIAYSPDGKTIVSSSDDNTIRLWNAQSGKTINTLKGHSDSVYSIAYSPDGKTIASGSSDNTIRLWNAQSGEAINKLKGHSGLVQAIAYSPDGKTITSGSTDNTIQLWNARSGEIISTLKGHLGRVRTIAYSPDGKTIASGSSDNTIRLWNAKSGETINTLKGHSNWVQAITYSPDGKTIASGSHDSTIRLWNAQSGETINILKKQHLSKIRTWVQTIAYSPDGKTIAAGSSDKTIRLWNAQSGETINTPRRYSGSVFSIAYSPDGQTIASGSDDNTIRLWNAQSGEIINAFKKQHLGRIQTITYSPDGQTIASGSDDNTIRLWNAQSGETINTLKGHSAGVSSIAYSFDGKTIASGSDDNTIRLWNTQSGETINPLIGHKDYWERIIAESPDGKTNASNSDDNTIRLWNTQSGETINTLKGHSGSVRTFTYSPDGKTIASGSDDNTIRLWNAKSGETINTLKGHSGSVYSIAYSPDGKTIASGSDDNTIRLWNAKSGETINTLEGHSDAVYSIAYSPDGKIIEARTRNNIRLWKPNSLTPLYRFVYDFDATEVSGALRFLWELELEDLNFKYTPRPPSLFSQLGYHITWTDETRKYRPLLDMPDGDDTKMDQVVKWLEKRCAYKQPERYNCTPAKATGQSPD